MTILELKDKLIAAERKWGGAAEVIIYNDDNFVIEDAWYDRAGNCFAIQVVAQALEKEE